MSSLLHRSWVRRRLETAISRAFMHAYETVKVDPGRFLLQLQTGYGLPIATIHGLYTVDPAILDEIAERLIAGATKLAAVEGAGLGVGGLLTIVPDLSILAAITLRMIQKLSLVYGFDFTTEEEISDLWIA